MIYASCLYGVFRDMYQNLCSYSTVNMIYPMQLLLLIYSYTIVILSYVSELTDETSKKSHTLELYS